MKRTKKRVVLLRDSKGRFIKRKKHSGRGINRTPYKVQTFEGYGLGKLIGRGIKDELTTHASREIGNAAKDAITAVAKGGVKQLKKLFGRKKKTDISAKKSFSSHLLLSPPSKQKISGFPQERPF